MGPLESVKGGGAPESLASLKVMVHPCFLDGDMRTRRMFSFKRLLFNFVGNEVHFNDACIQYWAFGDICTLFFMCISFDLNP